MTTPNDSELDKLLYEYGEELTDVQHIKLRAAIEALIIDRVVGARQSQTDHLFSVLRHLGYKIDQRAVVRLSREWSKSQREWSGSQGEALPPTKELKGEL